MISDSKSNLKYYCLSFLFVSAFLVWSAVFADSRDGDLKVDFFDVGQGSAVFIEAPNKNQILVDGGPDDTIIRKLGETMPFFDKTIDLVVLTHPDADHLNGLIEVLKRYEVKQILETGIADNTAGYQEWSNLIKEKNIPVKIAQAGEKVEIADNLEMDILYPLGGLEGKSFSDTNKTSIVADLIYKNNSFLLMGDADKQTETILLSMGLVPDVDVLLVGHHGSKNSSGEDFLKKADPEISVIQAGKNNKYGHPSQETLQSLQNLKNELILRTDINKDIKITSDGKNINHN